MEKPEQTGTVQKGKIYELIITACNGLWRYRIGGKLGGQRKIPRLSNDRTIADQLGIRPTDGLHP